MLGNTVIITGAGSRIGLEAAVSLARMGARGRTGEYFERMRVSDPSARARDRRLARQLWEASERLVPRIG